MAGKTHPYIKTLTMSALVFFASVLFIYYVAAYVNNTIQYTPTLTAEQTQANLQPHGRLHLRK